MTQQSRFLVAIAACSGTGKSTVIQEILRQSDESALSVSFTSRTPRGQEQHGNEYFFVSAETFQEMIQEKDFLEWAEVHGNYYGTAKSKIQEILDTGKHVFFDIDVQGAFSIREQYPERSILIFLLPPSWEELKHRLVSRGTESPEKVRKRLETALLELPQAENFDYIFTNDDVGKTAEAIQAIIQVKSYESYHQQQALKSIIQESNP